LVGIVGDDELNNHQIMMRVMTTSRQELISFDYDSILSFLNTENK
jgi:hypothetical protein